MLLDDIKNPDKIVVFSTAPAIRVSLGEEFGYEKGTFVEGKMISLLRKLGADYVFDVTFGADMTIMEEANELVERIEKNIILPLFSSCCPVWVKFAENFYPKMVNHLSTAKSPIAMQGVCIKTYFAKIKNLKPENIVSVIITPCAAKKAEINRPEFNSVGKYNNNESIRDNDYVITTHELAEWAKKENIDFKNLEDSEFDDFLGKGSGAGVIFGRSGGVTESVVRTVYFIVNQKEPPENLIKIEKTENNITEASAFINKNLTLNIAYISGAVAIKTFIEKLKTYDKQFHFVEVMNCIGGCVGGGLSPKAVNLNQIITARSEGLTNKDKQSKIKFCYQNPNIQKIYSEFFKTPLSDISKQLLHTYFNPKK